MAKRGRKKGKLRKALGIINPNAAGIDIGATEIFVAVPEDRDDEPVRSFPTFTEDLRALGTWLLECGITTAAMESTGVYWIPLFQVLEEMGIEVSLVNSRHVKNVPGRKSDVQDCQWLQYLHAVGLLRGSFRPPEHICELRALARHRDGLVQLASKHVLHVHKALTQMNLQLHNVISDITGKTGLRILDAILAGERDQGRLADLSDYRVKADHQTIRKSLVGDYLPQHLFTLRQSLASYRHYQDQIAEVEAQMIILVCEFDSANDIDPAPNCAASPATGENDVPFSLADELCRVLGTDLTQVPGFEVKSIQTLLSELGADVAKFPSAGHFASWLPLCPNNRITGGKVLSSRTKSGSTRAAQVFRIAAQAAGRSQSYLGQYYRRMRARNGAPYAVTATAHKLARVYYHLVKYREPYDESVFTLAEARHLKKFEAKIRRQARQLGFELIATENVG